MTDPRPGVLLGVIATFVTLVAAGALWGAPLAFWVMLAGIILCGAGVFWI